MNEAALQHYLREQRQERLEAILNEPVDTRDWSAETVEGATLADLDEQALSVAREKFAEKYRNASFAADIPTWDTATFLDKAKITIQGRITHYTRLLLENQDLPLNTMMLLDRVQKKQPITDDAAALLRKDGLIEGRKPNYYTAAQVARSTGNKSDYIRNRAFNDAYYKALILDYLKRYGSASRAELVTLILDKLSYALDEKQKQNKFRNLLNTMSTRDQTIEKSGGLHKGRWVLKVARSLEP